MKELPVAYPNSEFHDRMMMDVQKNPEKECEVIEVVYRNHYNMKEEEYKFCAIAKMYEHKLYEETFKGLVLTHILYTDGLNVQVKCMVEDH